MPSSECRPGKSIQGIHKGDRPYVEERSAPVLVSASRVVAAVGPCARRSAGTAGAGPSSGEPIAGGDEGEAKGKTRADAAGARIGPGPQADPAAVEFFEKSVRPILAARCQGCHGPAKQKGGLRLDARATILAGGTTGPAVVPGNPKESLLVDAINYGETYQMPPKSKLPPARSPP